METLPWISSLFAGVAAGCLFLWVVGMMEKITVERAAEENPIENKRLPILIKIMTPLAPNFAPLVRRPLFDSMRKTTDELLQMAGYDQTIDPVTFLSVRILLVLAGFLFFGIFAFAGQPHLGLALLAALFLYPGAWLKSTVRKRHLEILKALPNVLDLLTLSVEAGKDFLTALRDIVGRRRIDALGEELIRTLSEIQLGKARQKALKEMSDRVRQPELTSIVNSIIQADELGVSIGHLLRIQGDQLRNKRFSRAEKLANEAPVKILFPVIVFIFPSVIIILMAPIIMQAFKMVGK
jgi:tight adherence protein C